MQAWIAEEPERQLAAAQQFCKKLQQQIVDQQQHAEQVSISSSGLPFQDPLLHLQVLHAALQRLQLSDTVQASGLLPFELAESFWCLTSWVIFFTWVYHRVYITGSISQDHAQVTHLNWHSGGRLFILLAPHLTCLLVQT